MFLLENFPQFPDLLKKCLGDYFFPWVFGCIVTIAGTTAGSVVYIHELTKGKLESERDYYKTLADEREKQLEIQKAEVKRISELLTSNAAARMQTRSDRFKLPFVFTLIAGVLVGLVLAGLYLQLSNTNMLDIRQRDAKIERLNHQIQPLEEAFGSHFPTKDSPVSKISLGRKSVTEAFSPTVLVLDISGKKVIVNSKANGIFLTFKQPVQ